MKIKQVYISDENFENLKLINASSLINKLLNSYFKPEEKSKVMTEEEEIAFLEKMLAKKQLEEDYKLKMEKLN